MADTAVTNGQILPITETAQGGSPKINCTNLVQNRVIKVP